MLTLVIETATAACSVALIDDGRVVAHAHEVVGRGHAERLIPMIADLPCDGRAPQILVDCGPGSFTGIRVGIAAARGLALGWGARLAGYSSLSLLAATALAQNPSDDLVVVLEGGHGEVFMQGFTAPSPDRAASASAAFASLSPAAALIALGGRRAVGTGVRFLTALDPALRVLDCLPDAAYAVLLPADWATLAPTPIYGRAPDAKPQAPASPR